MEASSGVDSWRSKWPGWFSLGRVEGGPTYYPDQDLYCPAFLWYVNITLSTLVFVFPVLVFVILLPSFRKKHWPSCLLVLLCCLTGFLLTVVYGSSSWLVGEAEVVTSVGPLSRPVRGTVGLWVGLRHSNLTYITADLSLNEVVTWTTRADMEEAHKAALKDGWPWALLSLTAELGGEARDWDGTLGVGISQAGTLASFFLYSSMYVWGLWVVLFMVVPELALFPLMLSGTLLNICTLVYALIVARQVPHMIIVSGGQMHLHLGSAWWLTTGMGLVLTLVGGSLWLYDVRYPGQLSTIFLIDFNSMEDIPSYRASCEKEPVLAYNQNSDTYSQLYPPWPCYMQNTKDVGIKVEDKCLTDNNIKLADGDHVPKMESLVLEDKDEKVPLSEHQAASTPRTIVFHGGKAKILRGEENLLPSWRHLLFRSRSVGEGDASYTLGTRDLRQDQQRTFWDHDSGTLRRRSPPQKSECESSYLSDLLPHTFGNVPERQQQDPSLGPRRQVRSSANPSGLVRSCRKSVRRSLSQVHSKLHKNYSKSSPRARSNSLSSIDPEMNAESIMKQPNSVLLEESLSSL